MAVDFARFPVSSQTAARNAQALRQVFKSLTADSCPRSYNFHMHTVYSDGRLQPDALMVQAVTLGLRGLAITDHHSIDGYLAAQRWLDNWQRSPDLESSSNSPAPIPHLWVGAEINADLLNDEVHILSYAFDPEHRAMQPYLQGRGATGDAYQAARVIAAVHQAGGIAVLAHPARYRRSPNQLIQEAARLGIDGVEAYYAYNNPSPWQPSPNQTKLVEQLGETYGLLTTCGTDTHGLSLLQRL